MNYNYSYLYVQIARVTTTDRDEIWIRQRGATEAYREYAARSDEAGGAKSRPRCEELL